jgi:hypothetical protein
MILGRLRDKLRARDASILLALTLVAMLPLFVGRYLPFFDYPAHLSIPAVLRHRLDPATDVASLWQLDLRLVPNSFHYAFTWALSFVCRLRTRPAFSLHCSVSRRCLQPEHSPCASCGVIFGWRS